MTANEYLKSIQDNFDGISNNMQIIDVLTSKDTGIDDTVAKCDDCISRSDAIAEIFEEFMTEDGVQDNTAYRCIDIIKNMPSVRVKEVSE